MELYHYGDALWHADVSSVTWYEGSISQGNRNYFKWPPLPVEIQVEKQGCVKAFPVNIQPLKCHSEGFGTYMWVSLPFFFFFKCQSGLMQTCFIVPDTFNIEQGHTHPHRRIIYLWLHILSMRFVHSGTGHANRGLKTHTEHSLQACDILTLDTFSAHTLKAWTTFQETLEGTLQHLGAHYQKQHMRDLLHF